MLSVMQSPHGPGLPYPPPRPPCIYAGSYPGYPTTSVMQTMRIKAEPDGYGCCTGYEHAVFKLPSNCTKFTELANRVACMWPGYVNSSPAAVARKWH